MHLLPRNIPNYSWLSETPQIDFLFVIGGLVALVLFCGMSYFVKKLLHRFMADVNRLRDESIRNGRRTMVMEVPPPPSARPPNPVCLDLQDQKIVDFDPMKRQGKSTGCVICLNEFVLGQSCRVLQPCNHIFHERCVNKWLKKKRTCPLCRVDAVRLRIVVDDN
ncbi:hypothetical protein Syun_005022 [Stephania yunnanensis]|uniref:RING-type domain-containing protein n=1 Tax=Stephania yunnanensis TaxID=152371 RepID=A0AAP0L506_9MAGN